MNIEVTVEMFVALVAHKPASSFDPVTYEFIGVYPNFTAADAAAEDHVGFAIPEYKWMGSDSARYAVHGFADHTRAVHIKTVKV